MKLFRNSFLSSVIFTMLLATAVACTVKLTDVGAQKKADSNRYKYYTSVEVKPGDTLTSIARGIHNTGICIMYQSPVDEI